MCAPVISVDTPDNLLHTAFLSILPKIQTRARIVFRDVKCPEKRGDRISEVVALAWKWFRRLAERGKNACAFPMVLADFACRAVKSGRRLCGQLRPNDVLSELAQQRRNFAVEKLPDYSTLTGTPLEEALQDNRRSTVPDQVAFRLDFPSWLATLSERDQRIIEDLALGHRTMDVARKYGISPGRVSQLREQFRRDWLRFERVGAA